MCGWTEYGGFFVCLTPCCSLHFIQTRYFHLLLKTKTTPHTPLSAFLSFPSSQKPTIPLAQRNALASLKKIAGKP
ncbi:hypothetical protein N431DRAFT_434536, partial [Stipitochalara longipes BDJ]